MCRTFDVLVSLVFYIGTSYLMNVHFGSKDFHLSCGFSFMKKPSLPLLFLFLILNKVRGYILCVFTGVPMDSSLQNGGFVCHQGFIPFLWNPTITNCGNLARYLFHQAKKSECFQLVLCLALLVVLIKKEWDNIIAFGFLFRFVYRRLIN